MENRVVNHFKWLVIGLIISLATSCSNSSSEDVKSNPIVGHWKIIDWQTEGEGNLSEDLIAEARKAALTVEWEINNDGSFRSSYIKAFGGSEPFIERGEWICEGDTLHIALDNEYQSKIKYIVADIDSNTLTIHQKVNNYAAEISKFRRVTN